MRHPVLNYAPGAGRTENYCRTPQIENRKQQLWSLNFDPVPLPTPSTSRDIKQFEFTGSSGSRFPFERRHVPGRASHQVTSPPAAPSSRWEPPPPANGQRQHSRAQHRFSAGDADRSSPLYQEFKPRRRLPESHSLTFDRFDPFDS